MNTSISHLRSIICFGSLLLFAAAAISCSSPKTSRLILLQNYKISASNESTEVKVVAYFRDSLYDAKLNAAPTSVRFNGTELVGSSIESYENLHAFENHLDRSIRSTFEEQLLNGTPGFLGTVPGFSERNMIEIVSPDNEVRTLTLNLNPARLERSKLIELSRSRSNVIQFSGGVDSEKFSFGVGIYGSGNDFDETLVQIDKKRRTVTIPPDAFARIKNGPAQLFAISAYAAYLDEMDYSDDRYPRVIHYLSSYNFVYTDQVDIVVVD